MCVCVLRELRERKEAEYHRLIRPHLMPLLDHLVVEYLWPKNFKQKKGNPAS